MPTRSNLAPLVVVIALTVLLPAAYGGAYWYLATPGYLNSGVRVSNYRYGGTAAEFIFRPLEWLDRRMNPDAWVPLCVQPAE